MNHIAEECYSKHGFPPWIKPLYKGNVNQIEMQSSSSRSSEEERTSDMNKQTNQSLTYDQVQQLLKILHNSEGRDGRINTIGEAKSLQNEKGNEKGNMKGNSFWILDTGATDHVTCLKNMFITFRKIKPLKIGLPNGAYVHADYAGTVQLTKNLIIYDVYYIPTFILNIVYVQRLINHSRIQCLFSYDECQIKDILTLKMVGHAKLVDGLYIIVEEIDQSSVNNMTSFKNCDIDIWHFRLGHSSNKILDHICKNNTDIQYDRMNICDFCYYAKQHKLSFPNSKSVTQAIFDLVHIDIWGPFSIASIHGHRYFLKIVDDYSKHTWVFLMKNKSGTRHLLNSFVAHVQTQFGKRIKVIKTDNGCESNYKEFYDNLGIVHQTYCIETPQ